MNVFKNMQHVLVFLIIFRYVKYVNKNSLISLFIRERKKREIMYYLSKYIYHYLKIIFQYISIKIQNILFFVFPNDFRQYAKMHYLSLQIR